MNDTINTGGPAFPVPYSNENDGPTVMPSEGMTLRDYFAAKAMQGLLINEYKDFVMEEFAEMAYAMADAMLKAREVQP